MNATDKTGKRKNMRKLLTPLLFLLIFAAVGIAGAEQVHADARIWHEVNMNPGDTYDVSKAESNTTIFISKPGDYTLKGESRQVRVIIESDGANLYLADGLNINCGPLSYAGSRSAAIWIYEFDGTCKIISKQDADIYLEGYMCPGIRKEGADSEVVFETENPDLPGTITVQAGLSSAGIGTVMYTDIDHATTVGNMTFNSGNIVAKGADKGAGIGGSDYCSVSNITINGGNITAIGEGGTTSGGGEGPAGIGAGMCGCADGITINGGTVYAQAVTGAAIGSGAALQHHYYDAPFTAQNIIINGGIVRAKVCGGGAAIGASSDGGAKNVQINGGDVEAINNGTGPGIGCGRGSYNNPRQSEVKITGGYIVAEGAGDSPGIGAGRYSPDGNATPGENYAYTEISGGTVIAKGGSGSACDIGGVGGAKSVITGGSIYVESNDVDPGPSPVVKKKYGFSGTVEDGDGQPVRRMDITCNSLSDNAIAYVLRNLHFWSGPEYGVKDVNLLQIDKDNHTGMFYPWLPTDGGLGMCEVDLITVREMGGNTRRYYGNLWLSPSTYDPATGELNPGTEITLINEDNPEGAEGSAACAPGQGELFDIIDPEHRAKTYIGGYYTKDNVQVADRWGALQKNVDGCTDENGRWNCTDKTMTLYCRETPYDFNLLFDGNQPRGASTQVDGQMNDVTQSWYESFTLDRNAFTLAGYDFTGWNTKADGSGTPFADGGEVSFSGEDYDSPITLYAQWQPKKYNLTLDSGVLGKPQVDSPDMTFDAHEVIPAVPSEWSDKDYDFHCWVDENGKFYDDAEDFCNLVRYDGSGNPVMDGDKVKGQTLTAVWIEHGKIAVTVTVDGTPDEGHENDFVLIDKNDINIEYTPAFTYGNGVYTFTSPADETDPDYLPPGEYYLSLDTGLSSDVASSELIDFQSDATASVVFDYYTVSIEPDPVIVAISDDILNVNISGTGFLDPSLNHTMIAPDNASLAIETNMNPERGYHFDGYSVIGTIPGNAKGNGPFDPAKPDQTITVAGTSAIIAHAKANDYTVHFDANADAGVTGKMDDQNMVYDQPQDLSANQFKRTGAAFAGWNTKKDGDGAVFADKASVKNLTKENGGAVTLYAQWKMKEYSISYELDGGSLPAGKDNPKKYTVEDTFTLNNPEKEDYNFVGWLGTGTSEPEKKVTISKGSTGDRDYAAIWAIKQFTVRFEDNGGTGTDSQIVQIHHKAMKPEDPTREDYTFAGWYADKDLTQVFDFGQEIVKDTTVYAKWTENPKPPAEVSGTLLAKMTAKGKTKMNISWLEVTGADGYDIFFSKCKHKGKKTTCKLVMTIDGGDVLSWEKTGLKKGKTYKAYVKAFVMKDGEKQYVRTSPKVHAFAGGGSKKYTNPKSVKVKKTEASLAVGKTFKIKASVKKLKKKRKLINKGHAAKLRYLSSDTTIATVSKTGKIKAKAAGSCKVYVYSVNGVYKTVNVTVK